ncbi:DUF397 domain-containing protein [Streptomyces sp. NPDC086182]|uniref:DUF397 domain-containing protein n=1 Tax=Streptomyces sp. NPDC086182 TaxID=3155058 RepID=UPI00343A22D8
MLEDRRPEPPRLWPSESLGDTLTVRPPGRRPGSCHVGRYGNTRWESPPLQEKLKWRKSSYSGQNGGDCIECAVPASQTEVLIRDSKNAQGPRLGFTTQAWEEFVQAAATGLLSPAV